MENPQRLHVQPRLERLEANWVVGFVDGEGCFFVGINPHQEMTTQYQVLPEFTVVQHQRDIQLLHALKKFFGCGVVRRNHAERMAFRVRRLEHLNEIIVPFFEKHPLKSKKRIDFRELSDGPSHDGSWRPSENRRDCGDQSFGFSYEHRPGKIKSGSSGNGVVNRAKFLVG